MKIIVSLLFLLAVGTAPARAEIAAPLLARSGKTLKDFVPAGWKVLKQAEGDLNKDGVPDAVLALASIQEDASAEEAMEAPRPLLILLKQADGSFVLSGSHPDFILCKMCGGVFGDPLEGVKIERGTVVVTHYGGSNQKWGTTHRFRFQDGDWYLIGQTEMSRNGLTGEHHETDKNLVTGDVIETDTDEKGKTVTKKSKPPKAPLQKLKDVKNVMG
jgi:hypothetical protein